MALCGEENNRKLFLDFDSESHFIIIIIFVIFWKTFDSKLKLVFFFLDDQIQRGGFSTFITVVWTITTYNGSG